MKKGSIFKKEEEVQQQILPLFDVEKQKPWWQYQKYSMQEIDRINNYFVSNHTALQKDLVENDVKQNMKIIANKIGVYLPPYFTQDEYLNDSQDIVTIDKKEIENQNDSVNNKPDSEDNNSTYDSNKLPFFILNSLSLDYSTMKVFNLSLLGAKIRVLRINNNKFDYDTLNEVIKILQVNKIIKLFFDWNNIDECENKDYFYDSLFRSCPDLEIVTLRKQNINDEIVKRITDTIIECQSTTKIKLIDLFQNNITNDGLVHIERLFKQYPKLSYLGLGCNQINTIGLLFNNIGKKQLNPQELIDYRKKEAERDAIVAKNAKNKGKAQEDVPYLEVVKDIGGDKFAYFYNEQFQYLNLIQNPIKESEKEQIETFLNNAFDGFTLSLSGNIFDKKTSERLKKKFGNKITFS